MHKRKQFFVSFFGNKAKLSVRCLIFLPFARSKSLERKNMQFSCEINFLCDNFLSMNINGLVLSEQIENKGSNSFFYCFNDDNIIDLFFQLSVTAFLFELLNFEVNKSFNEEKVC